MSSSIPFSTSCDDLSCSRIVPSDQTTEEGENDRPKRPLSAYNFFFQEERQKLLARLPVREGGPPPCGSHGKIGFANMAKTVAAKWKLIDPQDKKKYEDLAKVEQVRYRNQLKDWKKKNETVPDNNKKKRRKKSKSSSSSAALAVPCAMIAASDGNSTVMVSSSSEASLSTTMLQDCHHGGGGGFPMESFSSPAASEWDWGNQYQNNTLKPQVLLSSSQQQQQYQDLNILLKPSSFNNKQPAVLTTPDYSSPSLGYLMRQARYCEQQHRGIPELERKLQEGECFDLFLEIFRKG